MRRVGRSGRQLWCGLWVARSGDRATTGTRSDVVVTRSPDRGTFSTEGLPFRRASPRDRRKGHVDFVLPIGKVPGRRGPAPFLRGSHQTFVPRIVVQVIELLLPEPLGLNCLGVPTWLPEATFPIGCGLCLQRIGKARGKMASAKIAELATGELTKIRQRTDEPLVDEGGVKNDQMHVRRHNDERVDSKLLVAVAEREAIRDDSEGCFGNKYRQPFDDGVGEKVNGGVGEDSITLHGWGLYFVVRETEIRPVARSGDRATTESEFGSAEKGDLRSGRRHGRETVPQLEAGNSGPGRPGSLGDWVLVAMVWGWGRMLAPTCRDAPRSFPTTSVGNRATRETSSGFLSGFRCFIAFCDRGAAVDSGRRRCDADQADLGGPLLCVPQCAAKKVGAAGPIRRQRWSWWRCGCAVVPGNRRESPHQDADRRIGAAGCRPRTMAARLLSKIRVASGGSTKGALRRGNVAA